MFKKSFFEKTISIFALLIAVMCILCSCRGKDNISSNDVSSDLLESEIADTGVIEEAYETFIDDAEDITIYEDEYLFDDTVDEEWTYE